jgi:hypothetical protein
MITASIDEAALDRDQRELVEETIRLAIREVNNAAYNVAYGAMLLSPHGNPRAIEQRMRAPALMVKGLRPHDTLPSVANALVNARRGRRGKKGLTGEPMRRASENLIRRKMLGAYYIAAGWLEAMKVLANFVDHTRDIPAHIVDYGLPDGDAIPAKRYGDDVTATIINLSRGAETRGRSAAEKALENEADDLIERFEEKLEKLWNRN